MTVNKYLCGHATVSAFIFKKQLRTHLFSGILKALWKYKEANLYVIQAKHSDAEAGQRCGYDHRQHHPSYHFLCPSPADRQHLSAAVQHRRHMGGRQICQQRSLCGGWYGGTHYQHAHWLFHGSILRRGCGDQPVLRRKTLCRGRKDSSHRHRHDADSGHRLYGSGSVYDPLYADADENTGKCPAGVHCVSDHLFLRYSGTDAL